MVCFTETREDVLCGSIMKPTKHITLTRTLPQDDKKGNDLTPVIEPPGRARGRVVDPLGEEPRQWPL